jgi:hypothetical protein
MSAGCRVWNDRPGKRFQAVGLSHEVNKANQALCQISRGKDQQRALALPYGALKLQQARCPKVRRTRSGSGCQLGSVHPAGNPQPKPCRHWRTK